MSVVVKHFGNTANNAAYLLKILEQVPGFKNSPRITEWDLTHAISSPAWENCDFQVPSTGWVADPAWIDIPAASKWTEMVRDDAISVVSHRHRRVLRFLSRSQLLRSLLNLARFLMRKKITLREDEIGIFYGGNFLAHRTISKTTGKRFFLEHGTIRWAGSPSGSLLEKLLKFDYANHLRKADFVFVTNLDPESLENVRRLVPGPWCALPHPYIPTGLTPFARSEKLRAELLLESQSDFLILLGASHNWSKSHAKGTEVALQAFRDLRKAGYKIGLVTMEWGLDLARTREFLEQEILSDFVVWLPPRPRFALQKLAACCDLSWNQFGYDGIGALDLRMIEQGLPHISRGFSDEATQLTGTQVPWLIASCVAGVVTQTENVLSNLQVPGYTDKVRSSYRDWIDQNHSPKLVGAIFSTVANSLQKKSEPTYPHQDLWKQISTAAKSAR